jgi:hypothetical protein
MADGVMVGTLVSKMDHVVRFEVGDIQKPG